MATVYTRAQIEQSIRPAKDLAPSEVRCIGMIGAATQARL
jgi:hypothetical protein